MQKLLLIAMALLGSMMVAGLAPPVARLAAAQPVAVTTYHNDTLRTGWNSKETTLTASNFPSNFGILQTVALDDQVDAQPLVVPGVNIAGGTHDVVYVATASNTVYAIDASSGAILLSRNLGAPVPTPLGCINNGPNVGITGTPVIDLSANTIYVIAYVNGPPPAYQLHALNITTLQENISGSPVTVAASHTLTNGSVYNFNASVQRQRPALLEIAGNVYAAFGSFCDLANNQSRGWVLGWNSQSLSPLPANKLADSLSSAPFNFFLSSVWMSGYGISSYGDPGSIPILYLSTGNSVAGSYTGTTNVQESVIRLLPDLTPVPGQANVFTPQDHDNKDDLDDDLGSGGVLILPNQPGPVTYLAVMAGKDGALYLFDRHNINQPLGAYQTNQGCWCGPSYFVGPDGIPRIVTSHGNVLQTWHLNLTSPPSLTPAGATNIVTGQDPGFFTSVSSNGTQNGSAIIWAVGRPAGNPLILTLYAFGALAVNGSYPLLYSSYAGAWPSFANNANVVPTVANGKVYIGSYKALMIFGAGSGGATAMAPQIAAQATLQPNPIVAPASPHLVSGILRAVDRSILTLEMRTGKSVKIDDAQAIGNRQVGVPLNIGIPLTVQGSMIEGNGALLATSIVRAKGTTGEMWPPDR